MKDMQADGRRGQTVVQTDPKASQGILHRPRHPEAAYCQHEALQAQVTYIPLPLLLRLRLRQHLPSAAAMILLRIIAGKLGDWLQTRPSVLVLVVSSSSYRLAWYGTLRTPIQSTTVLSRLRRTSHPTRGIRSSVCLMILMSDWLVVCFSATVQSSSGPNRPNCPAGSSLRPNNLSVLWH